MKQQRKLLFTAVILAGVIAAGFFAYRWLSADTAPKTSAGNTDDKKQADDFTVYDTDGKEVTLSSLRGKPVVVNFWATWCPPCRAEMPHFEELYQKYGNEVEFMMVDMTDGMQETEENADTFIREEGYTFPYFYDSDQMASDTYEVSAIPMTLLIDREGRLVSTVRGGLTKSRLLEELEKIM